MYEFREVWKSCSPTISYYSMYTVTKVMKSWYLTHAYLSKFLKTWYFKTPTHAFCTVNKLQFKKNTDLINEHSVFLTWVVQRIVVGSHRTTLPVSALLWKFSLFMKMFKITKCSLKCQRKFSHDYEKWKGFLYKLSQTFGRKKRLDVEKRGLMIYWLLDKRGLWYIGCWE